MGGNLSSPGNDSPSTPVGPFSSPKAHPAFFLTVSVIVFPHLPGFDFVCCLFTAASLAWRAAPGSGGLSNHVWNEPEAIPSTSLDYSFLIYKGTELDETVTRVTFCLNIPSHPYHSICGRQNSHPQDHPKTHGLVQSPPLECRGGVQLDSNP